MNRRFPFAQAGALAFICATLIAAGQTPAPPAAQLTQAQKEAAAAIQAPQTAVPPPPLPGQLQNAAPASPTPPAVSESSASKMQVLDAVTQKPAGAEVPRAAAPSDKLPVTSSTSTSRQFIVHGKVFETRSAMSTRCEEISDELRKVLNDKEPWVLPVVVVLNTGEEAAKVKGQRISTAISELNFGGFHIQVTINEGPGLSAADLRKEVVRALLAERILRNHQKIATPEGRLLLPDWIMTGVLKAMEYRSSSSSNPSALFSTLFHSGKIYGIEEIIEVSPAEMDSLSRTIYETSCCALVLALVDQPSGPQHLNKFLNALASDTRSERELLSAAFPNFAASASSLNKWWSLQLAALAKPGIGEPFTPAESLKAIEEAITLHYEALPAAVPKNVKMHPFVLPPPLQVIAANEVHAPSSVPTTPTKPRAKEASGGTPAEAKDEPAADDQKPKRSLLRRMLFLGDADKKEDEPKAGDKPPETAAVEKVEEEKKPGFMGRLFGAGGDEKKVTEKEKTAAAEKPKLKEENVPKAGDKPADTAADEKAAKAEEARKTGLMDRFFRPGNDEKKAAEKEKAVVVEKPKTKPKAEVKEEPEAKEEKKPSKLNPMNWFRGDKKPAEEKTEDKPAKEKDKKAFVSPPASFDVARMISPALADAWQWLAPAAPRQTVDLLKFLKRKPKPEEAPPPPPVTRPAEDDRPPVKKSSKPRSTNPNSKSTAKSKTTTTNPNAKPVPAGMAPPAAATASAPGAAAPAAATGPELVKVSLPLEEYQHILKHPDRSKILSYNIASLRALELRVSVLFRPVVTAYLAAVLDLDAGKTKDMDKRLAVLHEFALVAYQKSIAVRDYLDWFEASESGGLSGKFNDFLNLPETIKKELPARTDPISKYLDAVDKEFSQ